MGWVEEIGTGIYNVNRYLPFYAPVGKASFKEDVIFTTTIPIPNPDELRRPEVKEMTSQDTRYDTVQEKAPNYDTIQYTNQVTDHVTNHVINHVVNQDNLRVRQLLEACKEEKNREELMNVIGLKNRGHFMREYLNPAVESCLIAMTIPAKPKSSKQKYRITEKGKIFLRSLIKQHEG
jgi:predicted transcriptional regulator